MSVFASSAQCYLLVNHRLCLHGAIMPPLWLPDLNDGELMEAGCERAKELNIRRAKLHQEPT